MWIPSIFTPSSADDDDPSPSNTKENISAVFRGVANFLAPPPTTSSPTPPSPPAEAKVSSAAIAGIKNDLAELQGTFKSGISKLASNFLPFNSRGNDRDDDGEEEEEEDVGINEEVVEFVRKISGRPELWTDFPLSLPNDFRLSDIQREHAAIIDDLVPELAILRQKSCSHISEDNFWLIYLILLYPRLSEEDMERLSSPEVVNAREALLKKLHKKADESEGTSRNSDSYDESDQDASQNKVISAEAESSSKQSDSVAIVGSGHHSEEAATAPRHSQNSEFSFCDLEDEDSDKVSRSSSHVWVSEAESSKRRVWKSGVRDKESEGEESWHNVDDDVDFDSLSEA